MNESLLSKIIVGVVTGVITWGITTVVLDYIKTDSTSEPQGYQSSSRTVNRPDNSSPSNSGENQSSRQNPSSTAQPNSKNHYSEPKLVEENYSSYINPKNRANVSVIIVDAGGNLSNTASSEIAAVYQKAGKSTSVGLIRSTFIRKPDFQELCEGNSGIIQKLNLGSYADYLAIGKINFASRAGKLVDGTIVCSASISMSIISTSNKSLIKSFAISNANGNGADESQAKADALQKLLDRYFNEHSSL